MWRVRGGCVEGAWRVRGGCVESACRVARGWRRTCRLRPRAATSVQRRTPLSVARKALKAAARCFLSMLPCSRISLVPSSAESTTASDGGAAVSASTAAAAAAAAAASRSSSLAGAWPAVILASCSLGQLPPRSLPPPSRSKWKSTPSHEEKNTTSFAPPAPPAPPAAPLLPATPTEPRERRNASSAVSRCLGGSTA